MAVESIDKEKLGEPALASTPPSLQNKYHHEELPRARLTLLSIGLVTLFELCGGILISAVF